MKQVALTLTYTDLLEGNVPVIPRDFHFHILTTHLMHAFQCQFRPEMPKLCACLAVFFKDADLAPYWPTEIDSLGSIMGKALDDHPDLAARVFEGRVFVTDFPEDFGAVIHDLGTRVLAGDFVVNFDVAGDAPTPWAALSAYRNIINLYGTVVTKTE